MRVGDENFYCFQKVVGSEDCVVFPDVLRHRQSPAATLPNMQWVRADIAPGTVAKPYVGKLLLASSVARPEFCIPTSIETV